MITAVALLSIVLTGCDGDFPTSLTHHQRAEDSYALEQLTGSLNDIKAWHKEHKTGLVDSLRKGIPSSSIETAFSRKRCRPTDETKALWSWHNGENSPLPFIWYHDFLSMEEAQSEYDSLLRNPLIPWDPDFIPIFTFEGEWYAAYCGPGSKTAGPVVHFFLEQGAVISYANLTTFLASMAEALQSGAVSWKNAAMVENVSEIYRIHQKHNPGYPFPYHVPDSP